MTGRSIPEWKGRTPDTQAPRRVRLRVFDHWCGRCYLSGIEILPGDIWHLEHIKSLKNGGENRESNLAPALVEPHKLKSAREATDGAKADRIKAKHLGLHKSAHRPIPGSRRSPFKHKLNGRIDAWERRP